MSSETLCGDEDAPEAVAPAVEGETKKPAKDSVTCTLLPLGVDEVVATWAADYMLKRAELLQSMGNNADCVEWAEKLGKIRGCSILSPLLEKVDASGKLPPVPDEALPFWAIEAEINSPIGGEGVIVFTGREHTSGEFWARLEWGMYVVTKTTMSEPFGTVIPWESPIVLTHNGGDVEISTPEDAQDLARAIADAAAELAEVRRALGDAFITDAVPKPTAGEAL